MPSASGKFVWYELMTTDSTAAERFYCEVVGWRAQDSGMTDMPYTILSAADAQVGGLMALPAEALKAGARPGWIGYIAVDDVDAYSVRVTQAGGTVHKAASDIPTVGRFAVVADPHGAAFVLFKPAGGTSAPAAVPGTSGHTGWHELHSGDLQIGFAFYSKLFGWTKAEAVDMGPMGVYQIFKIDDVPVGGMMTKTKDVPMTFWLYYFNVDGIDAAEARVKKSGGRIINGPHQVPGGSWIIQGMDPQGAMFALVAQAR